MLVSAPNFGGVPAPNLGGCSKFSGGGVPAPNFRGGFLQCPEYGHRSAGTHPTGMHSCVMCESSFKLLRNNDPSTNIFQLAFRTHKIFFQILRDFIGFSDKQGSFVQVSLDLAVLDF